MVHKVAFRGIALALALVAFVSTMPAHRLASAAAAPPAGVSALGVSQGSGVVYAGAADGLYRSDAAPYDQWLRVNTLAGVPQPVRAIAPNPTQQGDLFLIAGNGPSAQAYVSADGGVTLAAQTIFPTSSIQLTGLAWAQPDPLQPAASVTRLYATGEDGENAYVTRSDDGGRTWRQVRKNEGSFAPQTIISMAVRGDATVLLATGGYHGGGLEETTDGGASWMWLTEPPILSLFSDPAYVAVSPTDAASIWTWWDGVLWHSADGGHTWAAANQGIADTSGGSMPAIDMQFIPRMGIAFLHVNSALYWSLAGGRWERLPSLAPLGSPMATVWRSGYLLATTTTGQLRVLDAAHLPTIPEPPLPGTWTATSPAVAVTGGQTTTLLPDRTVLVAGGSPPTANPNYPTSTAATQLFDPITGQWHRGPAMHGARRGQTATLLADGRVLVAGGFDQASRELSSVEIYDPHTHAWAMAQPLHYGRGNHTATLLRDGRVLIAGGRDRENRAVQQAELYTPATGTWTDAGSLPPDLQFSYGLFSAVRLKTGDVLLLNPGWTQPVVAVYAPRTDVWLAMGKTPLAFLTGVSVATLRDGRALAVGGESESTGYIDMVNTAEVYDATTQRWDAIAPMPFARAWGAAVTLRDGRVLVVGGNAKTGATAAAEIYDPKTDRWSEAQPMQQARGGDARLPGGGLTATLLPDGRVLVLGGSTGADAEIFDPGYHFTPATQPAGTAPDAVYVPATDHSVAAPFVAAFRRLGPYLLGNPLTEPYRDHGVLTQVFDHLRLELRGGHVVAGAMGRDLYRPAPRQAVVSSTATRRYFPRTGQVLSGDLLTFWRAHGGEAIFGEPISGVIYQRNGDGSGRYYPSQWFENARLEVHPEITDPRFHVLLGLVGGEWLAKRGWR